MIFLVGDGADDSPVKKLAVAFLRSFFTVSTVSEACMSFLSKASFNEASPFSKRGFDFFGANGANGVVGVLAGVVEAAGRTGALTGVTGVGSCGLGFANGAGTSGLVAAGCWVGKEEGFWGVGEVTDAGIVGVGLFVGFKVTVTVVAAGLAAGSGTFGATTVGLLSRTLFGGTVLVFG